MYRPGEGLRTCTFDGNQSVLSPGNGVVNVTSCPFRASRLASSRTTLIPPERPRVNALKFIFKRHTSELLHNWTGDSENVSVGLCSCSSNHYPELKFQRQIRENSWLSVRALMFRKGGSLPSACCSIWLRRFSSLKHFVSFSA